MIEIKRTTLVQISFWLMVHSIMLLFTVTSLSRYDVPDSFYILVPLVLTLFIYILFTIIHNYIEVK